MKKFVTLRSEVKPKFSQMSKELQSLWPKKYQAIQKAKETQEEAEEEEEKTIGELLAVFAEGIISNSQSNIDNAKNIKELAKQIGIILPEKEEEKPSEANLEQISKSLSEQGLNGRFVNGKRRLKF